VPDTHADAGADVAIGRLAAQDLPALAALYRAFRGEESSLPRMRSVFRRLESDPSYIFLAARETGRLVGTLLGIVCEELYGDCRPFVVVEDLIVDPDRRRRGVGASLIAEIEQLARHRGCSYIMFVTDSDRAEARSFYQSQGYVSGAYAGFKKYLEAPMPAADER
jgi:ribosomal protein S18 acetylase RimI-like enzyme